MSRAETCPSNLSLPELMSSAHRDRFEADRDRLGTGFSGTCHSEFPRNSAGIDQKGTGRDRFSQLPQLYEVTKGPSYTRTGTVQPETTLNLSLSGISTPTRTPIESVCGWCGRDVIETSWDDDAGVLVGPVRLDPHRLDESQLIACVITGRPVWHIYPSPLGPLTSRHTRWANVEDRTPLAAHQCGRGFPPISHIHLHAGARALPNTPPF